MHRRSTASSVALPPSHRLWLAFSRGRQVTAETHEPIGDIKGPEAPMSVVFEGLTDAEQRAALAAFPGGKRFVLATQQH